MWRVAIVGVGYWAEFHLAAWATRPDVKVTALCDLSEERLRLRGEQYGIPRESRFTDVERMLEREHPDIVDILTPPNTHSTIVTAAASHGAHVMCIKPLAISMEDGQKIAAVAREYGIRAMASENWRWLTPLRKLRGHLQSGLIGRPYYVRYSCMEYATPLMSRDTPMEQPFFRDMPRLLLYEMGTHWFDVWRFLFGEPHRIYAETRHISAHVVGEDLALVTVAGGDVLGLLEVSWASRASMEKNPRGLEQMVVEGDKGTIVMESDAGLRLIEKSSRPDWNDGSIRVLEENAPYDWQGSIEQMQAHFLNGIEREEPFETDIDDNLKTLRLVFAAYESAERHEPVSL